MYRTVYRLLLSPDKRMKASRIDIGSIRREQIVEQREQARARIDGENPQKVFPLRERKHAGAS